MGRVFDRHGPADGIAIHLARQSRQGIDQAFDVQRLLLLSGDGMAALEEDIGDHRQFEMADITQHKETDPGAAAFHHGVGGQCGRHGKFGHLCRCHRLLQEAGQGAADTDAEVVGRGSFLAAGDHLPGNRVHKDGVGVGAAGIYTNTIGCHVNRRVVEESG